MWRPWRDKGRFDERGGGKDTTETIEIHMIWICNDNHPREISNTVTCGISLKFQVSNPNSPSNQTQEWNGTIPNPTNQASPNIKD